MTYDLLSDKAGHFKLNKYAWPKLLKLAQMYGWKPKGTKLYRGWNGSYFGNDGQFVERKDARNLAQALAKALDDIPDYLDFDKSLKIKGADKILDYLKMEGVDGTTYISVTDGKTGDNLSPAEVEKAFAEILSNDEIESIIPINPDLNPLEFFGGDEKEIVKRAIEYFKAGQFCIV